MAKCVKHLLAASVALPLAIGWSAGPVAAEPLARDGQPAGSVIARKSGEEIRFIDISSWRFVDLKQDLLPGDVLRTNATGQLAILFSDRTQVRLGRNSALRVRSIAANNDAVLELEQGSLWARAQRGGTAVEVRTPAATAAIRGTDWTMTVTGAQTSLTVLEGLVELKNEQGSVEVAQGEAAAASIGQAPRKIVVVDSDDREQMLFYLAPRNAFSFMPPSPLKVSDMRAEIDRISAIPVDRRSTEDWLTLAETQRSLDGRDVARETLAVIRQRPLSAAQRARADLVEATIVASEKNYVEAIALFRAAGAHLDPKRKEIARFGEYYARSLSEPDRVLAPPRAAHGPYSALLGAYAEGFLKDIAAAIEALRVAERRYPDVPALPAYRAQLALLLNDREQVREAIDRALALDPNEPTALEARAHFRASIKSDVDGAIADINAAIAVAPGSSSIWNALGNLQSVRGDEKAAEEALKKAIALDPEDPVSYANLALLYLDQSRVEAAKEQIDLAIAADPTFDVALVARGRYHLQTGDLDQAVQDLLAASVANPSYSQAQVLLAAAHLEKGDRVPADQAIDNAERLDDNDPVISSLRASIAIEDYDSEAAIRNAQEFLRRARARGGHFASLSANQDAGSTLNSAFRLQGLNAWGEYYGDVAFDAFAGSSYFDQLVRGSAAPFANGLDYGGDIVSNGPNSLGYSAFIQGLLLDPHMLSGRTLSHNIVRRPFVETTLGGGFTHANGDTGYVVEGEVQGYSNLPFPVSFYFNAEWEEAFDQRRSGFGIDMDTENRLLRGNGYLTATPTPDNRVVAYFNRSNEGADYGLSLPWAGMVDSQSTAAGFGLSHTVDFRNVVNAAFFYTDVEAQSEDVWTQQSDYSQQTFVGAFSHSIGQDDLTWRYGFEAGYNQSYTQYWAGGIPASADPESEYTFARSYVDLLHEITPEVKAEYALFGVLIDGDGEDVARLEPRAGIAWTPTEGHWLRAAFSRQSLPMNTPTLSPIGVLGLQPNELSTGTDGYVDTVALRWDAEWTENIFTVAEFQHQEGRDVVATIPFSPVPAPFPFSPFSALQGRIDRASLTTNLYLGQGFGLSSAIAYAASENEDPLSPFNGGPLPFVPEWAGQVALTWVNEANVKATIAANYVGQRDDQFGLTLDDYWTLDASLGWEPFGKRMIFELAGYNLLGEDFEVATGVPGWGPSFRGSMKVRF